MFCLLVAENINIKNIVLGMKFFSRSKKTFRIGMPALRSYALNNEHQTALSTQKMKFQQLMENSPPSLMWRERGYGGAMSGTKPPASQSARLVSRQYAPG